MFSNAFVVGASNGPAPALVDAANCAEFARIEPFTRLSAVETALKSVPSCFFLFAPVADISRMGKLVRQIRQSRHAGIRYAPLIYFCNTASREVIRACVTLGFDDVIAMPFSPPYFRKRLTTHMDRPVIYFETRDYLGPDRREEMRTQERGHSQTITFQRHADIGIRIADRRRNAA
ncbi:hypothetical protein [Mariluticola halotolerans]|uniref:hypothetical protein n=1 Tax=Mariluticola halotolerans TaxID=2909283 RepID=UPI0026E36BE1|nr:hypothetical protein [Mariluticola halotolerans]UJQ93444.1 hypothetical protein L1P08_10620 [Mariluticola halotolerans]